MADLTNRSRYRVSVKNRPDLTRYFSFSKLSAVKAYPPNCGAWSWNGYQRKLVLRRALVDLLRSLPRTSTKVIPLGLDYVVGAWNLAAQVTSSASFPPSAAALG